MEMLSPIIASIMLFLLGLIYGRYTLFIIRATFLYYWFFKKKMFNTYFSILLSILVTLGILIIYVCSLGAIAAYISKNLNSELSMFIFILGLFFGIRFFSFLPKKIN